ncbi:hypothetical protein DEO72_LG9g2700 [Vigna unguiculata]|uniref:Uncharacterized protein n=1 Tax=Vigna unguiculata TaxID=3917 RepID=A0A4D6N1J4_VIGUN|nr:hypothetical protein DEO72_LG9g2700 [Vigna unguiculata]
MLAYASCFSPKREALAEARRSRLSELCFAQTRSARRSEEVSPKRAVFRPNEKRSPKRGALAEARRSRLSELCFAQTRSARRSEEVSPKRAVFRPNEKRSPKRGGLA